MGWISSFFSLFFPRCCRMCGEPLHSSESTICTVCVASLPYTEYWKYSDNPVAQKFWGQSYVVQACSLLHFRKGSKVRKLLHQLKYRGKTDVGYKLGYLLGSRLKEEASYADVCLVLPVPLHPKKHRERGYNQSDFIAQGVADALGVEADCRLLKRTVHTSTQTRKNRIERFSNVDAIFCVDDPATLNGRHILIVDDIITTGATIESCASTLLHAASCRVSIASIGTV